MKSKYINKNKIEFLTEFSAFISLSEVVPDIAYLNKDITSTESCLLYELRNKSGEQPLTYFYIGVYSGGFLIPTVINE